MGGAERDRGSYSERAHLYNLPSRRHEAASKTSAMSIVNDFEKAFNRRDVPALVGCFTDDASYRDNFYGEHRGQAALRSMFDRMFREGRDYRWVMDTVVESGNRATGERTFGY